MIRLDELSARPGRMAASLAAGAGLLIVLHLLAMQGFFNDGLGLRRRFDLDYWHVAMLDLDEEESFGTWFSSILLLLSGILSLAVAKAGPAREAHARRWWQVLGVGFLVLSVDEVAGMHEFLNTLMGDTPWTYVGFPILALVALAFCPFLWRLRWRTALILLLAGAIYGGGAVGVEHWTGSDVNSLGYNMWTALEEGMEMAGVILFIYGVLDYVRSFGSSSA